MHTTKTVQKECIVMYLRRRATCKSNSDLDNPEKKLYNTRLHP